MARKRKFRSASTSTSTSISTSAATLPLPKRAAILEELELPRKLILDILSRLPAKSLFRLRCVCKSWDALFYDPHFLKQHYSNSLHRRKLMMKMTWRGEFQSFEVPALCRDKSRAQGQPLRLPFNFVPDTTRIVGCCNGVVCLTVHANYGLEETIYFWNPLTNHCIEFPYIFSNPKSQNVLGFGFDESTNEFKLARIFVGISSSSKSKSKSKSECESESENRCVKVYGMWWGEPSKRISDFPYGSPRKLRSGVWVNGALHWLAYDPMKWQKRWVVAALDMAKETFRPLFLPDQLDTDRLERWDYDIKLYCVGELLCFMFGPHRGEDQVWIMKEYGAEESWIKLLTIPYPGWLRKQLPSLPLCYSESNGELLMIYEGRLVSYLSRDNSIQHLGISCFFGWYYFDAEMCNTYVETLFTPQVMERLRLRFKIQK